MKAKERLEEISEILKKDGLNTIEKTRLKIEEIWARSIVEEIDPDKRISNLEAYLEELETEKPEVFNQLIQFQNDDQNELMRIADQYSSDRLE